MEKSVGFVLFERWHGRPHIGSSMIRGRWLIKYWREAEIFTQGRKYEAVIFQKVYWLAYCKKFKGIKILDLCDPDWLQGQLMVELFPHLDAITTSTQVLADEVREMTDKPVYCVPDRMDLDFFRGYRKRHEGRAKSVVWFGYAHNLKPLDMAVPYLKRYGLDLYVISDLHPIYHKAKDNIKFEIGTVNREIIRHDFVVFPHYKEGKFRYKSNNKTLWAWALGMPVATVPEDLEKFLDPQNRQREADRRMKEVREKWDVRLSVRQMKDIIQKCRR